MAVNQVIVGDEVKLDLTGDTVSVNNLLAGATAHNAAGEPITGAVVTVPVDSELSETSENPVQNKAAVAALSEKASSSHSHSVVDISDFPEIPTGGGGEFTIIVGTYTGTGQNDYGEGQFIDLGVTPVAVLARNAIFSHGSSSNYTQYTGLAVKNSEQYRDYYKDYKAIAIATNGFNVYGNNSNGSGMSQAGQIYNYIAFVPIQ